MYFLKYLQNSSSNSMIFFLVIIIFLLCIASFIYRSRQKLRSLLNLTEINNAKDNEIGIYIWLVHSMTFWWPLWQHLITSTFMCTLLRHEYILFDNSNCSLNIECWNYANLSRSIKIRPSDYIPNILAFVDELFNQILLWHRCSLEVFRWQTCSPTRKAVRCVFDNLQWIDWRRGMIFQMNRIK